MLSQLRRWKWWRYLHHFFFFATSGGWQGCWTPDLRATLCCKNNWNFSNNKRWPRCRRLFTPQTPPCVITAGYFLQKPCVFFAAQPRLNNEGRFPFSDGVPLEVNLSAWGQKQREKTGRCGHIAAPAQLGLLLSAHRPERWGRRRSELKQACGGVGRWQLDTIIFSSISAAKVRALHTVQVATSIGDWFFSQRIGENIWDFTMKPSEDRTFTNRATTV